MGILFRSDRKLPQEQVERLFRAVGWMSGDYPAELTRAHPAPEYLRLLGAGNSQVLREIARRATLPMLDAARLRENAVFRFECHVTDLWALTRTLPRERQAGQEFTRPFVRP